MPRSCGSADLERAENGDVIEVAGMVVARQRPETAKGIVFMLLEDERGTVNLVVPKAVYERCRAAVRAAPLVRAKGRLERHEGTTNVVVGEVVELSIPKASARRGRGGEGAAGQRPRPDRCRRARVASATVRLRERAVAELRAVAPVGHSWGRRRRLAGKCPRPRSSLSPPGDRAHLPASSKSFGKRPLARRPVISQATSSSWRAGSALVHSPKTLREKLRQLEPVAVGNTLGERYAELLWRYGDRAVVTPEGRWCSSPSAPERKRRLRVELSPPTWWRVTATGLTATSRRLFSAGKGKRASTQPPALGLAAVVLVVTCAQRSRAMKDPKRLPQPAKDELKDLVRSFVAVFGKESGLKEDIARHPLSVASERFFGLRRDDGLIWFEPGELERTIDAFVADLSSKGVGSGEALDAFRRPDRRAMKRAAAVFDGAGMPRIDKQLSADILDRLRRALDGGES